MSSRRFKSLIQQSGSRAIIAIPFDPDDAWGTRLRHYVRGSINGCTIRGMLESAEGGFFLALGPAWRRDNGLAAGAKVMVELSPDGPQSDELSADLAGALDGEPEAKV